MKFRHLAIAAAALFLPLGVAACGDDSTGDIDKGELTSELEDAGYTKAQAECAADKIIAADFTEDEVEEANKSLEGGNLEGGTDAAKDLIQIFTGCITDS